ncbi:hypothetical protein CDD83_8505 [Cordyceps sp. RAO-2017]|nr:hypothetical protein CDD83_8505 [Cordyceps sp. RAO-2017]
MEAALDTSDFNAALECLPELSNSDDTSLIHCDAIDICMTDFTTDLPFENSYLATSTSTYTNDRVDSGSTQETRLSTQNGMHRESFETTHANDLSAPTEDAASSCSELWTSDAGLDSDLSVSNVSIFSHDDHTPFEVDEHETRRGASESDGDATAWLPSVNEHRTRPLTRGASRVMRRGVSGRPPSPPTHIPTVSSDFVHKPVVIDLGGEPVDEEPSDKLDNAQIHGPLPREADDLRFIKVQGHRYAVYEYGDFDYVDLTGGLD